MPYRLHVARRSGQGWIAGGNARTCIAERGVTQIPQNKTCCIRRIAATQVTDPATFSALLIAMPVDLLPLTVDERVQVAAHAPRECA